MHRAGRRSGMLLAAVFVAAGGVLGLATVFNFLPEPSTLADGSGTPFPGPTVPTGQTPEASSTAGSPTATAQTTPVPTQGPLYALGEWPRDQMALQYQAVPVPLCYSDLWAGAFGDQIVAFVGSKGSKGGAQVVDVTDPQKPRLLRTWQPDNRSDEILEIRTAGRYVIFGGLRGIYVVDFQDLSTPQQVAEIKPGDGNGVFAEVHNMTLEGSLLFVADNRGPHVQVFDLSDPVNPVRLAPIRDPAGQDVHGVTALDGRLYTSTNDPKGWAAIWDISPLPSSQPVLLAHWDSGPMSHSAWPSPDGRYLAVNHETAGSGIVIWDIRDLSHPSRVATIEPGSLGFGAHSVHDSVWIGNFLYVAWGSSGAHIFDMTDPSKPVHVLGFDTTLGAGGEDTNNGAWGIFPFLGPDRVLTSDWHNGLFILDATRTVPASSLPRNTGASALNTHC